MPLISSFWLSKKKGKETWVFPVIEGKSVSFEIRAGNGGPPDPPKHGRGANFNCLVCGSAAPDTHIKSQGASGQMGQQLMAVVAEGNRGRSYIAPTEPICRRPSLLALTVLADLMLRNLATSRSILDSSIRADHLRRSLHRAAVGSVDDVQRSGWGGAGAGAGGCAVGRAGRRWGCGWRTVGGGRLRMRTRWRRICASAVDRLADRGLNNCWLATLREIRFEPIRPASDSDDLGFQ